MGWALITHPTHLDLYAKGVTIPPMAILERDLRWATEQQWIVLVRESEMVVNLDANVQSNPRRSVDPT